MQATDTYRHGALGRCCDIAQFTLKHGTLQVALLMHLINYTNPSIYKVLEIKSFHKEIIEICFLLETLTLTFNVRILKNRLSQSLHGNIGASGCRRSICDRIRVRSAAR